MSSVFQTFFAISASLSIGVVLFGVIPSLWLFKKFNVKRGR